MRISDIVSSTAMNSASSSVASNKPDAFTKVGDGSAEQRDGRKVAEEFTALFTNILVKEMWKASSSDGKGPFGDGPGADIYRGYAEGALSESIAKSGMNGLVDRIEELIVASQKRGFEEQDESPDRGESPQPDDDPSEI